MRPIIDRYHTNINAIIVDDERKACANLREILTEYIDPFMRIQGIAHDTKEAEEKIRYYSPDVVFLDIEMPNENAFQFLSRISPLNFEIVFVTAYDEYAVKAFKRNAVDYILKPISINEVKNAVLKVRDRLKMRELGGPKDTAYTDIGEQVNSRTRQHKITLKDSNRVEVVDHKDICFVEAQSSYSRIQFFKGLEIHEMIMSNPLSDYEDLLPKDVFYRIHRSYLINCRHIKKIFHDGSNQISVGQGTMLPISRRRYPLLIDFLEKL